MADPIAISLSVAAGVAAWWYVQKKQNPKSPDSQVVFQLKRAGSNVKKPHEVEFFFLGASDESAQLLSAELAKMGFVANVSQEEGANVCVKATKRMIPVPSDLEAIRKEFSRLGERYAFEYDGWGAGVVA